MEVAVNVGAGAAAVGVTVGTMTAVDVGVVFGLSVQPEMAKQNAISTTIIRSDWIFMIASREHGYDVLASCQAGTRCVRPHDKASKTPDADSVTSKENKQPYGS